VPTVNSDHPPKIITKTDFPALRTFLRGYFHQDMKDEYGSPEEAVREFCEDASSDERDAVAKEWLRFRDHTKDQPLAEVNRILTSQLGSSYALTLEDLQHMTAAFSQGIRKAK
jgi:hypothetical protein